MTDLKTWLKNHKISQRKFARALNYSPLHIHNVVNGKTPASPKLAALIERETDGAVSKMNLLYPDKQSGATAP